MQKSEVIKDYIDILSKTGVIIASLCVVKHFSPQQPKKIKHMEYKSG